MTFYPRCIHLTSLISSQLVPLTAITQVILTLNLSYVILNWIYNAVVNKFFWDLVSCLLWVDCSENRQAIKWRTVIGAFFLQAGFAALVLYVPMGQQVLGAVSQGVASMLGFANEGISFLFGDLADTGFIFAIRVLPLIIFISALISMLYYLGIMQFVIKIIGGGLQKLLGISPR